MEGSGSAPGSRFKFSPERTALCCLLRLLIADKEGAEFTWMCLQPPLTQRPHEVKTSEQEHPLVAVQEGVGGAKHPSRMVGASGSTLKAAAADDFINLDVGDFSSPTYRLGFHSTAGKLPPSTGNMWEAAVLQMKRHSGCPVCVCVCECV